MKVLFPIQTLYFPYNSHIYLGYLLHNYTASSSRRGRFVNSEFPNKMNFVQKSNFSDEKKGEANVGEKFNVSASKQGRE